MSTPFVGLKRVAQSLPFDGQTPWASAASDNPDSSTSHRSEARRRLIQVLETRLGVQSIQVGAFMMRLSEEVPERHLVKATHYLMEQLRQEAEPSQSAAVLEECLRTLLKS
jgi:hypothetical protein